MSDNPPAETTNTISGGSQFGPVFQGRNLDVTVRPALSAPLALGQLPARAVGFTGRDDELQIIAKFLDPASPVEAVVVSAVAGLAGVGKTALAVAAGHAARERGWYSGGVLFIDLHGYDEAKVEPGQALDALLRALGIAAEHIPPGTEERSGLYRSVLAQINEPVLVIVDNVSSETQARPLLPGAGPHRVVVTSRHILGGLDARLLDVTVLDDVAALNLLDVALRTARPDDKRISSNRESALRLAQICGGLPLALQIVAALLKADPTRTATNLVSGLIAEQGRLDQLQYDDGSGSGVPSVRAAFELSYKRLSELSAYMFRLLPLNPGPDVSTGAAAALASLPLGKVRDLLGELRRAHLIETAPGEPGRWRMHDLLHLYALRLCNEDPDADTREQARDRLLGYYLDQALAADMHVRTVPDTAAAEIFTKRDDALAWLDAERPNLVAAATMAAGTGRDQIAINLPMTLSGYLDRRRRFDDKVTLMAIARDAARRFGSQVNEGAALTNLTVALSHVRRFEEAIAASQDAVAIFRETGDRHREGMALGNLSTALGEARRFEEAIAASQDAVAIFREVGDRHGEGMALSIIGYELVQMERFEEAVTVCQDAITIFRETGDQRGEGHALTNLGWALVEARQFEEAVTVCQDAITIFRETGDRSGEDTAQHNLDLAWRGQQA